MSTMNPVDLAGVAIEANSGAPIVVLREHDAPHRLLPIFIGGPEAVSIAVALSEEVPPRPLTHDLMASLVRALGGTLTAVEVTEISEGSFLASLLLVGPAGEQRIDARPSDAIALALRLGAPLFVSDAVLDAAGAQPAEAVDESTIDDTVEEFRSFLDGVDPSHFAADPEAVGEAEGGTETDNDPNTSDDGG
jgi:bifunctional DNase/RNase